MQIKVLRTSPTAKLPSKAHDSDTGYDLFLSEDVTLGLTPIACPTGIKLIIPKGYWVRFMEKSGKALKGIQIHGGVIDEGFTGSLKVIACLGLPLEVDKEAKTILNPVLSLKAGEAICQFSVERLEVVDLIEIDESTFEVEEQAKTRKAGGFGSTGR